jgi:hypothetical protein
MHFYDLKISLVVYSSTNFFCFLAIFADSSNSRKKQKRSSIRDLNPTQKFYFFKQLLKLAKMQEEQKSFWTNGATKKF